MSHDVGRTVGERISRVLAFVPNIAATTSFAVLTLAFVHEWAFYSVIGGQYQSLVSITDYFNSAIGWLPWVGLGYITVIIVNFFEPMRGVPQDLKTDFYSKNRARWIFDNLPVWTTLGLGVFGGVLQLLFGDWYTVGFLTVLFIFVWAKIVASIAMKENMREILTKEIIYLVIFIPMFLATAYVSGMIEAASLLHPKREPNAIGRLKNQYLEREWVLLRSLASGVVVRDVNYNDRIRFIRWDDVAGLETKIVQPNRNGLVCRISGYTCRS